ncbi:hypothetical protein ACE193_20395 [Bernardetia sp. OM2101]|uniref:hypothetical protein n=1 Tax=Bernardetia sp. OM2101 TaxID=3344876 RepID=UPI0035CF7E1B
MDSAHSNLKKKFKFTALQWSALVILPLFIFALVIKVQERQESENTVDKVVNTQNSQTESYMIQTVSQPVVHDSERSKNSDSAK